MGVKPYGCLQCGKTYADPGDLKKHQLTHYGEKSHDCTTCEKSFSQSGNLKEHFMTHSGDLWGDLWIFAM